MEKMDLKRIERQAYTSYHQDGLIDIIAGFSIVGIGVWIAYYLAWTVLIFVAIFGPFAYAAAKRAITVPRIGFVKFPQQRVRLALVALVGLFSLTAVAFIQIRAPPGWLVFAIENFVLVIGVSVAALFGLMGYTFRIGRMYAYALLTLPTFAVGHFLEAPLNYGMIPLGALIYPMIPLGALILLVGSVMLIRFVRKYPLPTTGSLGETSNEGK